MESTGKSTSYIVANSLWQSITPMLKEHVNEQNFEIWLSPVRPAYANEQRLVLLVPNSFLQEYLHEHYRDVIQEELLRQTRREYQVDFEVARADASSVEYAAEAPAPEKSVEVSKVEVVETGVPPEEQSDIQSKYRFQTFVVGASNQFAYAVCQAVAERPGGMYNPLFLFGGVGLGKTHLLHAIGNQVIEQNPNMRVRYLSSEGFVNDVINSIRYERVEHFHRKYREECDVLLIDDIQFIAGKDRSQVEFFHTFNCLHAAKRQIVVTSDKMPQEIPNLELRLKSRLQWGLVADIRPPEMETRVAILKRKADEHALALPDDVAFYLATNVSANVRELEGSLLRLVAYAELRQRPISLDLAQSSLRHLARTEAPVANQVSVESVQQLVCTFYEVSLTELKGTRRSKDIIVPRQVAMYLSRKLTGASFPEIGVRFDKDHATVINAVNKVERSLASDASLRLAIDTISAKLLHHEHS